MVSPPRLWPPFERFLRCFQTQDGLSPGTVVETRHDKMVQLPFATAADCLPRKRSVSNPEEHAGRLPSQEPG